MSNLKRIIDVCRAATPGPWECIVCDEYAPCFSVQRTPPDYDPCHSEADKALIALASTELERLAEGVQRAIRQLEHCEPDSPEDLALSYLQELDQEQGNE